MRAARKTAHLLVAFATLACASRTREAPQQPVRERPRAPAVAPGPEIIELPAGAEPVDACAAEGPTDGILDNSAPMYRRLVIRRGQQVIDEKAFLRAADVSVEVHLGGCAHYGVKYIVSYEDEHDVGDRAYHVGRALDILEGLRYRAGATTFIEDMARMLRPHLDASGDLGECDFPDGEMVNIYCGVERDEDGRVQVSLSYDVVL